MKAMGPDQRNESKLLYLIKLIKGKRITLQLLAATKIGKVFTKITQLTDVEDKEVLRQAGVVLEAWKEMNRLSKESKSGESKEKKPVTNGDDASPTKEVSEPSGHNGLNEAFSFVEDKPFEIKEAALAIAKKQLIPKTQSMVAKNVKQ